MKFNITLLDQLRNLAHDELIQLANWCQSEARKKDPVYLKEQAQQAVWEAERQAKYKEQASYSERVTKTLKDLLKPGMMLKMKGCKDGLGLREFIRWDNNGKLICWQILRRKRWSTTMVLPEITEQRTNVVTTHMADKVSRVYINGTGLTIKSILK